MSDEVTLLIEFPAESIPDVDVEALIEHLNSDWLKGVFEAEKQRRIVGGRVERYLQIPNTGSYHDVADWLKECFSMGRIDSLSEGTRNFFNDALEKVIVLVDV